MNTYSFIREAIPDNHCANICASYVDTIIFPFRTHVTMFKFEVPCYNIEEWDECTEIGVTISPSVDIYAKYADTKICRSLTTNRILPEVDMIQFSRLYKPTDTDIPKCLHPHVDEPFGVIVLLDTCTNNVYIVKRSDTRTIIYSIHDTEIPIYTVEYSVNSIWIAIWTYILSSCIRFTGEKSIR